MTEQFTDYDKFFQTAFVGKEGNGQEPFDYQRRLALDESLPALVNVPTGAGKITGDCAWLKNNGGGMRTGRALALAIRRTRRSLAPAEVAGDSARVIAKNTDAL